MWLQFGKITGIYKINKILESQAVAGWSHITSLNAQNQSICLKGSYLHS